MLKKSFSLLIMPFIAVIFLNNQGRAQQTQTILLAGYKLQPTIPTPASGLIVAKLINDSLRVNGDFSKLSSPFYGAYVMFGEKGEAGNQLFSLNVNLNQEKTGGVLKASENTFALSPAEKNLLLTNKLYIIISSFDHQRGEIGGRIRL